uniref:RNA recognition motif protein n=1 Tax=Mimivirus LCMiAC01 TaxID=2506608 RepID=A0A481Z0G7_9VIRU|nr:MAG: RNA recognition motif protein [Mimivirus LCMiAC01]
MDKNKNYSEVFVKNVPYKCTNKEFRKCFSDMKGYIIADIKKKYNSEYTRGFGFVIFDNENNANKLLTRSDDIIIKKNRKLKFSPYIHNVHLKSINSRKNHSHRMYRIYIDNVSKNITVDRLIQELSKICGINNYSVKCIGDEIYGKVSFENYVDYKKALVSHIYIDETELRLSPYRRYKHPKRYSNPNPNPSIVNGESLWN